MLLLSVCVVVVCFCWGRLSGELAEEDRGGDGCETEEAAGGDLGGEDEGGALRFVGVVKARRKLRHGASKSKREVHREAVQEVGNGAEWMRAELHGCCLF
jgi:hypothetical protein